ncbi:hypothetical protein [Streptomyces sp. NPDC056387]|uniref:hypothetical protein n=1 Tax=Streptomyces sp. NPDC056387 TaxID=3345803 RepID=UPI0035D6CAB0
MIKPGQTYLAVKPSEARPDKHFIRIKVVGVGPGIPGIWGYGKVDVVTLTADGREVRRRSIEASQLHATATTRDGQHRRTGYVLEAGQ